MNKFEQRKQRRIEIARKQAEKNEHQSETLFQSAREMASAIPLGQPILTGHHSEKRDRKYREKIHDTYARAFEAGERAEYYRQKARTIELNDNISSDDPDVLQKLEAKLADLQQRQEFMRVTNKCIRTNNRNEFMKLPEATEELWTFLNVPDGIYGRGFPRFKLTNNSAAIRQVKRRIADRKALEGSPVLDREINGIRVFENRDMNRVQLLFTGKPDDHVRRELKSRGFRWAPSEGAWQRSISPNAKYWAVQIAESTQK